MNGDAFSLGFSRLEAIGQKILEIFPEVETIASYASIESIARKTDEELKALRRLREEERLLTALSRGIAALDEDFLAARPKRGFEGRYVS